MWKHIHMVFNEVLLTPYHEPKFPTQLRNMRPPPEVVEKELEYEVEEVLDSHIYQRIFEYKIQWKGYSRHEQTWEPISNLSNAKDAIADFHRKYPNKLKPPSLRHIEIPISQFPVHLF